MARRTTAAIKDEQTKLVRQMTAWRAVHPEMFAQLRRLTRCLADRSSLALEGSSDPTQMFRHQGRIQALNELEESIFGDAP